MQERGGRAASALESKAPVHRRQLRAKAEPLQIKQFPLRFRSAQRRQKQSRKDGDDRDDHQQFNQSEPYCPRVIRSTTHKQI